MVRGDDRRREWLVPLTWRRERCVRRRKCEGGGVGVDVKGRCGVLIMYVNGW